MEAGFIVFAALVAIIGIVLGVHIEKFRVRHKNDQAVQGVLNVLCDDTGSSPQLFLQLIVPVEDVMSQKQTTFDVKVIK